MPSALVLQLASHRREARRRALSRGRRQKRLPSVHPPKELALAYAHFLQDLLGESVRELVRALEPKLRTDSVRMDAKLPPGAKAVIAAAKESLLEDMSPPRLTTAIQSVGGNVMRAQRKDILHQLASGLGFNPVLTEPPDIAHQLAKWTSENVSLIRTLPGQMFADIEETVAAGLDDGDTASDIADTMMERLGVAESRARLIARDQVGKFYGSLNRARQTANGIESYFWRTSEDNRVRDNHEELDGEQFDWDEPPMGGGTNEDEEGHPGSGIQCRCHADPALESLLLNL